MKRIFKWFLILVFGPLLIGGVGMAVFFYWEYQTPKMQAAISMTDSLYEHRLTGDSEFILKLLQAGDSKRFSRATEIQSFKNALDALEKRLGKPLKVAEKNYQYIDGTEFTDIDVAVKLNFEKRVNVEEHLKIRYRHAEAQALLLEYRFEGFK